MFVLICKLNAKEKVLSFSDHVSDYEPKTVLKKIQLAITIFF